MTATAATNGAWPAEKFLLTGVSDPGYNWQISNWGLCGAFGSRDRDPLVAGAGIGYGLDYAHITQAIFERRVRSLSAT